MNTPPITQLNMPAIINAASCLSRKGQLRKSQNNLIYLDIDDAFIHVLFPFLENQQIKMPDYFGEKSTGAHISVIYAEEDKKISNQDLGKWHDFLIKDLVAAEIGRKTYCVLLVASSSLLQLRKKYHLPDLLSFKGYSIDFHITIGVKSNGNGKPLA